MRQGAEQSAPTSFPYTITCMIMLIIINRIQLLYYSSFNLAHLLNIDLLLADIITSNYPFTFFTFSRSKEFLPLWSYCNVVNVCV